MIGKQVQIAQLKQENAILADKLSSKNVGKFKKRQTKSKNGKHLVAVQKKTTEEAEEDSDQDESGSEEDQDEKISADDQKVLKKSLEALGAK